MELVAANGCQSSPKSAQPVDDDISESSLASSSSAGSKTRSSARRKSSLKPNDPLAASKLRSLNNVKFVSEAPLASSSSPGVILETGPESAQPAEKMTNGEHIEDENRPVIRTSARQRQTAKKHSNKLENVTSTLENQDNASIVSVNRRMSLKSPARKRQKPSVFCPNDENTLDCFGTARNDLVVADTTANNTATALTNGDVKSAPVIVASLNGAVSAPSTPDVNVVDVLTNDENSRLTNNETTTMSLDEDSQSMQAPVTEGLIANGKVKGKKARKKRMSNYGLYDQIDGCVTSVSQLFIYKWPLKEDLAGSDGQDTYVLQEQISELIGVKSFKRKYPGKEEFN